jgi:hypothetical protein
VLFSTTAGRQKARNLARDPRVSLTVFDTANPYQSAEIRGTAELIDDSEKTLPRQLSQKYLGEDPLAEPQEDERSNVLDACDTMMILPGASATSVTQFQGRLGRREVRRQAVSREFGKPRGSVNVSGESAEVLGSREIMAPPSVGSLPSYIPVVTASARSPSNSTD